jgi:hypothetical protein
MRVTASKIVDFLASMGAGGADDELEDPLREAGGVVPVKLGLRLIIGSLSVERLSALKSGTVILPACCVVAVASLSAFNNESDEELRGILPDSDRGDGDEDGDGDGARDCDCADDDDSADSVVGDSAPLLTGTSVRVPVDSTRWTESSRDEGEGEGLAEFEGAVSTE